MGVNFWFDAGSNYASRVANLGQQSGTFDIACVQLEEGSVATPFEELPIEVSETRVNRYANLIKFNTSLIIFKGYQSAGGSIVFPLTLPVSMRAAPSITVSGTYTYTNTSALATWPNSNTSIALVATATASGAVAVTAGSNFQIFVDAHL